MTTIRPRLHFTATEGWINDPHGITWRDDRYHVFFQYVPGSTNWRPDCRWGHATGEDLFSLRELPVAIAPGAGDDGIWTGSLRPGADGDPMNARIFYTSVLVPEFANGRVREAAPLDAGWVAWEKGDFRVESPPSGLGITSFRDPYLYEDGYASMGLIGASLADQTAAALRYEILPDGEWRYRGVLASRSASRTEPVWMGSLWECPQLIPLGHDKYALVTSVWDDDVLHYAACGVGSYTAGEFDAQDWLQLTWGQVHYAPSAFRDREGRWCLLFWMRDIGGFDDGWAGAHSVPYLIAQQGNGIGLEVHPDIEKHRRPASIGNIATSHVDIEWTPPKRGGQLEAHAGESLIMLRERNGNVSVSVDGGLIVELPRHGAVRLLIDGGAVEIILSGRVCGATIGGGTVRVSGDGLIRAWALEGSH